MNLQVLTVGATAVLTAVVVVPLSMLWGLHSDDAPERADFCAPAG